MPEIEPDVVPSDWRVVPMEIHGWSVRDAAGHVVVDNIYDEDVAEQIVREHNSHKPLVNALRRIRGYNWRLDDSADAYELRLRTHEALALAEKEGSNVN